MSSIRRSTSSAAGIETTSKNGDDFAERLTAAMKPLQLSLRSLHNELGKPKNTVAMQRQLNIGNTICWQVSRVVRADSLVSAARHAPLPQATMQLLEAAERIGVSNKVLTEVREAAEGFRGFMKEHADDRASFDTLVAGVSEGAETEPIQLPHRRAAYRAESHIWGIQRDLSVMTALVRRSPAGGTYEIALLMSQFGYRRLRSNASATVFAFADAAQWGTDILPLDARAMAMHGSPLVPEFCSDPIPSLEHVPVDSGQVVYRLADNSLGRGGSKDLTTGVLLLGDPPVVEGGRPCFSMSHSLLCPTGRLVMTLLLDRESFGPRAPTSVVRLNGFGQGDPRGQPLPLGDRVVPLGLASRLPASKDVPDGNAMMRYLADRTGWTLDHFNSYRMTLDFPVFGSSTTLAVPVD